MRSTSVSVALTVGAGLLALAGAPLPAQPERAGVVVRGSVVLPDEGSPNGLHAYLSSGVRTDSVAIGEAGTFSLPLAAAHCAPVHLRIDTPASLERRYHPAIVPIESQLRGIRRRSGPPRDSLDALRILLVPTRVTIDGGTYAGTVVPIQIDAAFAPPWERTRYWRVSRSSADGFGTPVAWPDGFFPIPVTLRSRTGVTPLDSAAFWRAARQLEMDFGRSLFHPAPDEPATEEIWKIIVTVEPAAGSAGLTFVTYDSYGAIFEATIAIRAAAYFADARLVSHELMHALGFGHSTGWYSTTSSALTTATRATASDVAYAQLLYRLRRAHLAERATHGIIASSSETRRAVSGRASLCVR